MSFFSTPRRQGSNTSIQRTKSIIKKKCDCPRCGARVDLNFKPRESFSHTSGSAFTSCSRPNVPVSKSSCTLCPKSSGEKKLEQFKKSCSSNNVNCESRSDSPPRGFLITKRSNSSFRNSGTDRSFCSKCSSPASSCRCKESASSNWQEHQPVCRKCSKPASCCRCNEQSDLSFNRISDVESYPSPGSSICHMCSMPTSSCRCYERAQQNRESAFSSRAQSETCCPCKEVRRPSQQRSFSDVDYSSPSSNATSSICTKAENTCRCPEGFKIDLQRIVRSSHPDSRPPAPCCTCKKTSTSSLNLVTSREKQEPTCCKCSKPKSCCRCNEQESNQSNSVCPPKQSGSSHSNLSQKSSVCCTCSLPTSSCLCKKPSKSSLKRTPSADNSVCNKCSKPSSCCVCKKGSKLSLNDCPTPDNYVTDCDEPDANSCPHCGIIMNTKFMKVCPNTCKCRARQVYPPRLPTSSNVVFILEPAGKCEHTLLRYDGMDSCKCRMFQYPTTFTCQQPCRKKCCCR